MQMVLGLRCTINGMQLRGENKLTKPFVVRLVKKFVNERDV